MEGCINGTDTVAFQVKTQRTIGDPYEWVTMITHGREGGSSAMQKTTAWTCAIVADAVAKRIYWEPGTHPMEDVGANEIAFQYILDKLDEFGIYFQYE